MLHLIEIMHVFGAFLKSRSVVTFSVMSVNSEQQGTETYKTQNENAHRSGNWGFAILGSFK